MNTKQKRLALIGGGLAIAAAAVGLVMNAFPGQPLSFFFSPSQVVAKEAPEGRAFRIGGFVKEGSVQKTV